jgi:hypothetical protein
MFEGQKVYEVSTEDLHEGVNGICLSCGEVQYGGVEPDARGYPCDGCGAAEVHGLEEALLMDRVAVGGEP